MVCHCGPTALLIFFLIFSASNYYFFSVFESFLCHDVKIRFFLKKYYFDTFQAKNTLKNDLYHTFRQLLNL